MSYIFIHTFTHYNYIVKMYMNITLESISNNMNDRLCITISKTLAYSLVTVQLSPDNSEWLGPDQDDVNSTFA